MRKIRTLMLLAVLINVAACTGYSGNVVPQKGPGMEQLYDSMGKSSAANYSAGEVDTSDTKALSTLRERVPDYSASPKLVAGQSFKKLPNPELHLYVFPHLAGNEQIPIPGYYTAFDGYEHTYYALPSELPKG